MFASLVFTDSSINLCICASLEVCKTATPKPRAYCPAQPIVLEVRA